MGMFLALIAHVAVLGAWLHYLWLIPRERVPERPTAHATIMLLGMAVVPIGTLLTHSSTLVIVGGVLSIITWAFGLLFLWLLNQARVPDTDLLVQLDQPLPAFETLDTDANVWRSDALLGQRTLLKFYRGAWCPYCTAELQRFQRMGPELQAWGVQVVAVSRDTPPESAAYARRESFTHTLLCDPGLEAIEALGLLHQRGVRFETFTVLGIPLGAPVGFDHMAIPTSLLVDERGVVRWIDQAEDYRLRGDAERIRAALSGVFGPRPDAP